MSTSLLIKIYTDPCLFQALFNSDRTQGPTRQCCANTKLHLSPQQALLSHCLSRQQLQCRKKKSHGPISICVLQSSGSPDQLLPQLLLPLQVHEVPITYTCCLESESKQEVGWIYKPSRHIKGSIIFQNSTIRWGPRVQTHVTNMGQFTIKPIKPDVLKLSK